MGTQLKCPLCCEEEFPSRSSLKYHILGVADNLNCPECDRKFQNLLELAEHLGKECGAHQVAPLGDGTLDEELVDEMQQENFETIEFTSEFKEEETEYFCQICNINFASVEEHVQQYHQGEEVIVETDETVEFQPDLQNEDEATTNGSDDPILFSLDENEMTLKEENCVDNDGLAYTRKVVKIDQFWSDDTENTDPIIEKYISEKGLVRKLTEEEENTITDTDSIIMVHQCPKCYLQFPRADHYSKHLCNPLQIKQKYKCIHCTMVYDTLEELNAHMATHIQKNEDGMVKRVIMMGPHTCTICNTMFPSYRSFYRHQKMHDPAKGRSAGSPVNYTILGSKDNNGIVRGMFICTICNNTYDKEYEEVHMKSHIELLEDFDCSICNKKFHTEENLKMHVNVHKKSKKFSCTYCKKTFPEYEVVKDHVENKCNMRHYECQFCGRRFARPYEKVTHERIHTGEKPHVCKVCGKAFRVNYCLTLHMRTHSDNRPYECTRCSRRFKSHSVYNHHMRTHSDEKTFNCPYCPKSFKTRVHLAGHKNIHVKPFNCTECNRPFSSLYAVRAHMAVHKAINKLNFDCWLCGASYARACALKEHLKEQHSDAVEVTEAVLESIEGTEVEGQDAEGQKTEGQEGQETEGQDAT